jgi:AcrR family transcriptional regulator
MEAALVLAVRQSPARTLIDEVIAEADISRGTFYKYFDSVPALMAALASEVACELARLLDPLVEGFQDPATRLSCGLRIGLLLTHRHKVLGSLIVMAGWPNVDKTHLHFAVIKRDIETGIREGRFSKVSVDVALNLVVGSMIGGAYSMMEGAGKNYPEQAALCMLRGLGIDVEEAKQVAKVRLPKPKLPEDGIIARLLGAGEHLSKA